MTTTTNLRANNHVGDFSPVAGWLRNAIANGAVRNPRIKINTNVNGIRHQVTIAFPAQRPVVDGAPLFIKMDGTYVGSIRIKPDGSFFFPRGFHTPGTINALRHIGDNPLQAAVAHGHATGNCSFCARDLTDPRSTSVGYGPICASHFGLPWGDTGAAAARIVAPRAPRQRSERQIGRDAFGPAYAAPSTPIDADRAQRADMELARMRARAVDAERELARARELLAAAQLTFTRAHNEAQSCNDSLRQMERMRDAERAVSTTPPTTAFIVHAPFVPATEVPASAYPNGYTPLPNTDMGNIFANAVALNLAPSYNTGEE
jgi:hypothetical protein